MIHLGDIKTMKGETTPIVDVVTGGSPCQDLSVAGKRAGMAGERSGLFMEQIRLIKEMREYDRTTNRRTGIFIRPRFMVWENVPGAFSSNNGEDFRAVLEETAKIADPNAVIPRPAGRWSKAGCIMGDGWSIAWRLHDAQFWGVPQRRKRIALVADFGGESAPEILFERKGMSGDITESGKEGEGAASDAGAGIEKTSRAISFQERAGKPGGGKGILIQDERIGALSTLNNQSVCCLNDQGGSQMGVTEDVTGTLRAEEHGHQPVVYGISRYTLNSTEHHAVCAEPIPINTMVATRTTDENRTTFGIGSSGDPQFTLSSAHSHAVAVENHPNDSRVKISEDGMVQTLSSRMGTGGGNVPMVMEQPITASKASYFMKQHDDGVAETLVATDYKDPQLVAYGLDRASFNQGQNAKFDFSIDEELSGPQVARGPGAVCQSVVRRLTPLECERLQGFPDNWTNIGEWVDSKGKRHKDADSPRYKALGNSIALPYWFWLLRRISAQYERPATLGSLFDGIGGFPLCWERCNGKGTAIWASEIEEFPIAVTKYHFPE